MKNVLRKTIFTGIAMTACLAFTGNALADVCEADASNKRKTITDCLSQVSAGDVVKLLPGIYTDAAGGGHETFPLNVKAGISIIGTDRNTTIVLANNSHAFDGEPSGVTIKDMTIETTGTWEDAPEGNKNPINLTVRNGSDDCIISNVKLVQEERHATLRVFHDGNLILDKVEIINNHDHTTDPNGSRITHLVSTRVLGDITVTNSTASAPNSFYSTGFGLRGNDIRVSNVTTYSLEPFAYGSNGIFIDGREDELNTNPPETGGAVIEDAKLNNSGVYVNLSDRNGPVIIKNSILGTENFNNDSVLILCGTESNANQVTVANNVTYGPTTTSNCTVGAPTYWNNINFW